MWSPRLRINETVNQMINVKGFGRCVVTELVSKYRAASTELPLAGAELTAEKAKRASQS